MSLIKQLKEMAQPARGQFIFSFEELKDLQKVFKKFDGNVVNLVQQTMAEAFMDRITDPKKKQKLYDRKYLIKVQSDVLDTVEEFVQEGLELKNWYHDMSSTVFQALGVSDGCLFLLLVASTSPQNMLTKNLIEASQIFVAFKKDFKNNRKELENFIKNNSSAKANKMLDDLLHNHENLHLFDTFYGNSPIDIAGSKIKNVVHTFEFFLQSGGSINKEQTLEFITSGLDTEAKYKKDIFKKDAPVRALKVMNFAVNLIEPNYKFNNDWYAVTIDTWMIRFFYPYMEGDKFEKVRSGIFRSPDRYFDLVGLITEKAQELGMEPNKLQASIWVSKLKEEGKNVTSFQKTIDMKIAEMEFLQGELNKYENKFIQLIHYLASVNYSDNKEPQDTEEDIPDKAPF